MAIQLRSPQRDAVTQEYGGAFRRIYPWAGVAEPAWGSAFMAVAPGTSSEPHAHDEEETFIFIAGTGVIHVDDQSSPVTAGDVVYLPRFSTHCVENEGPEPLSFLTIWWGAPTETAAVDAGVSA